MEIWCFSGSFRKHECFITGLVYFLSTFLNALFFSSAAKVCI